MCFNCVKLISTYSKDVELDFSSTNAEVVNNNNKLDVKNRMLKPTEVKALLDNYVVGQERAKKALSIAVYNHYKRLEIGDKNIRKSNILMIGPTGSGKTYLIETLAKEVLDVPLVIADATTLTEAGFIGEDVENILTRLLDAAGGDVGLAERGIVFIDEIDKLAAHKSTTEHHVGNKGVQQALLKILEGSSIEVPIVTKNNRNLFSGSANLKATINTDNILFICGGAFPDMEDIIYRRIYKKSAIGFSTLVETKGVGDTEQEDVFSFVEMADLKEFGMIPELLGRLPIVTTLDKLSVETLKKVLVEPKGSLVEQYAKLLAFDDVCLEFEEDALERMAELAIEKGTGARALRSIMENVLEDVMYTVPANGEIDTVIITKDCVNKCASPRMFTKRRQCVHG